MSEQGPVTVIDLGSNGGGGAGGGGEGGKGGGEAPEQGDLARMKSVGEELQSIVFSWLTQPPTEPPLTHGPVDGMLGGSHGP